MLEMIAARDWKRHLLEPNGRDCGAAEEYSEAIIDGAHDGACTKMKKTRRQIDAVLNAALIS